MASRRNCMPYSITDVLAQGFSTFCTMKAH
uniref:Uncharacterized protein n=1 Tax=Anguilla anguilla TaxID=7936 RepID=A0A0E9TQA5_ANGAN